MADFKLDSIELGASGLDDFFQREPQVVTPLGQAKTAKTATPKPTRIKIGSISDLSGFIRSSGDTLVHKSTQDLWALKQDDGKNYYVERLFNDSGTPLKG